MPRLSRLLGEHGTIEIECPGDEPLVVVFRRGVLTPRLQAKVAAQPSDGAPTAATLDLFCDVLSRLVQSWNLTDDDGQTIPTTADAIQDVDIGVLMLILSKIGEQSRPDPTNGGASPNGSLATDGSEPVLITTSSS